MYETISDNRKSLKSDEKCFLFHVKSSFSFLDSYIFVLNFDHIDKRFDKKAMVKFKI